ncbi:unnamed protein product [Leptidea sinapis]|uniref:Helicase ATP-binding domain-containing protein n=1 Tax=Leptidea sinapis TaxID=189913 RepID=A0A5E4PXT8_9NEOP|nr:unnamed protein product [Leptidea sinapis]
MSESSSPSVLSYLRQYRFQKKPTPASSAPVTVLSGPSSSQSQIRMQAPNLSNNGPLVYKRIRVMDSDSDDAASPAKKVTVELTTAVKERRFRNMLEMFPDITPLFVKNTLVKHGWNEERSRDELLKYDPESNDTKPSKPTTSTFFGSRPGFSGQISSSNGATIRVQSISNTTVRRPGPARIKLTKAGSSGSEDDDYGVQKFNENKMLSTDLLNSTQELLCTRNNIQRLMKKCVGLAQQLEAAVAAGAGRLMGLNWLAVLHKQGVSGILADEMGLGKTVQVISFLAHLKETGQAKGTHLIVVPASTLERRQLRIEYAKHLNNYDVVLTTYTMVSSCPEERKMFRITPMHYVVYDEAHMLKNMSTQRYDNLLKIKNNLVELMSLLCFVMPHMFSGKTDDLKNLFQKNSKAKTTKKTNGNKEDDVPAFEQSQITQAKRIMKPFVLRRLKKDVLQDLPKKTNHTVSCPMSERQQTLYKTLIAAFSAKDGLVHATQEQSGMSMMMDMRKLANHPVLLRYYYQDSMLRSIAGRLAKDKGYKEKNEEYVFQDLGVLSDFQIHQLTQQYQCIGSYCLPSNLIEDSGKFNKLDEMLPKLKAEGHRVLIFSQFTMVLDVLESYLTLRSHGYIRLDGSTAVNDRQDLIRQYNAEDIFVFLLSTRAGGLGINLTAADTVIIHDIDFNPYNDKQAEDRLEQ